MKKGFTLIELLVVIAIIGILSSVVLASLNTARNKGADAAIKANLANARAQAELFYDTASIYTALCADTKFLSFVTAANAAAGGTYTAGNATAGSATVSTCHDAAGAWAASTPTKAGTGWCVDSTGASKVGYVAANATACP